LKTMDFTIISQITASGSVNAFESVCGAELDLNDCYAYQELKLDSQSDKDPDETLFIEGVVIYEDGTMRRAVDTLLPYKYLQLPKPDFNIEIIRRGTEYEIDLTTKTFAAFVELDLYDADVVFSENYFHITDEDKKVVVLKSEDVLGKRIIDEDNLKSRLQIRSIAEDF